MNRTKLDIKILSYLFVIFALLLLYNYFDHVIDAVRLLLNVMKPLFAGGLIAYILNIIVVRIEEKLLHKVPEKYFMLKRIFSILVAIFVVSSVIYLVIKLIVPQVVTMLTSLVSGIPVLITQLQDFFTNSEIEFLVNYVGTNLISDFNDLAQKVVDFATNSVNQLLSSFIQVISGATSGLFAFVIAFSFAMYILISKEKLQQQIRIVGKAFLPEKVYRKVAGVILIAHQTFSSFFVGQGLEAVILGVLCIIGMTIFRFPYALTIGTFIGFTALIPMFGAWIGAGVGFILIASQSLTQALVFVVFIVILQQLENNLIYPRVVGTSIGIPGMWVLVAITIGGGVGGILGMLLGVPVVATIYQIMKIITLRRMEHKTAEEVI